MRRYLELGTALVAGLGILVGTAAAAFETEAQEKVSEILYSTFATGQKAAGALGGMEIYALEESTGRVDVYAGFDREFLDHEFDEVVLQYIMGEMDYLRFNDDTEWPEFRVHVRYADDPDSEYKSLLDYLPQPVRTSKPEPKGVAEKAGQPPHRGQGQPSGGLNNKSIFVSAGHGWNYTSGAWRTQRGLVNGIIEDHANADFVDNFLVPYLWNAGAGVYTVRERDMNTNMVIVDNTDSGYSETGSWSASSGGYNGGQRSTATRTGAPTATATFTPNIPESGYYSVYVWSQPVGTTTSAASITINHAGGSTNWIQNQNRDGYTWKHIGKYYFEAGSGGSVVIDNSSPSSGSVFADAVRFGGGMGQMTDPVSGTTSGKPQFEESGYYYAGFMGRSAWASSNTVRAMPLYADWENESWEDPVYVSMHTNAAGGRGTMGLAHGSCWDCWGDTYFDGVPGSMELRNLIVSELVGDIRAKWDSGWPRLGSITRAYGELTAEEMPSMILEVGFHDNATDAALLTNPEFRMDNARSVYKGIVKYYAQRDNKTPHFLPEPPTHFRAVNNGAGGITLTWSAPPSGGIFGDPATGYRVYTSTHPKGFADGIANASTSYTASGLNEGTTYYFRVSATNLGGESFPSETLAVRYDGNETNPILIVSGFDRMDRSMSVMQAGARRHFLDRMNTYDYATIAAKAIAEYGQGFDSSSNEAVENGSLNLGNYPVVVWLLGEESQADKTLSSAEQSRVSTYLAAGGQLFISGSEIGFELDGQNAGRTFYNDILKTSYVSDDAGTYGVVPVGGTIFDGLSAFSFDNGSLVYDVDYPDTLAPLGGSIVCLQYSTGTNAAIQYDGAYRLVNFGFPYETITDPGARTLVMARVLDFFDLEGEVNIVPDLVIESRDAGGNLTPDPPYAESAGSWANSSAKSTAAGLVGSGSRFSSSSTPAADTVTVVPNIPEPGIYEVAVTWNTSSNATNVSYTVNSLDGAAEFFLDQAPADAPGGGNNNQWIVLGEFPFAAGSSETNGSLVLDESTVTGTVTGYNTGRVYSDGFRWRYVEELAVTPTPTATPSPTPTPTPSPTASPTLTPTPSPTATVTPSATPTPVYDGWPVGDFNNDRCTNMADFLYLLDHWQESPGGRPLGLNQFLVLVDNWQQGDGC